ncbi:20460_t:CDS:2, partial [Gigaspora margarita]
MPEFAEFDINDDILHFNPIKFHRAQANTATFHNCADHTFNGLYNNHVEFDFSSSINQTRTEQNEIEIRESDHWYKLQVGMIFHDWDHAMNEIQKYEKRQGFKTQYYRIKKLKNRDVWRLNLLCPEKDNPHKLVYVAKLVNEHRNYDLDQAHYNFQENMAFTTEMTKNIKFFVTKINLQRISFTTLFKYQWKCLLDKYSNKTGMSFTLRVESYNTKLKRLIFNSNMIILELAKKLTACVLEEDKKTEYALFRVLVLKAALVVTADSILPN